MCFISLFLFFGMGSGGASRRAGFHGCFWSKLAVAWRQYFCGRDNQVQQAGAGGGALEKGMAFDDGDRDFRHVIFVAGKNIMKVYDGQRADVLINDGNKVCYCSGRDCGVNGL